MKKTEVNIEEINLPANKIVSGYAIGPAFIFKRITFQLEDYNYNIDDIEHEIDLYNNSCRDTILQLKETKKISGDTHDNKFQGIFDSQIALLEDADLRKEIEEVIRTQKRSSAYAVITVLQRKKEHFLNLENDYFRDRAFDILDLKNRLLHALAGVGSDYSINQPSIIFSQNLTPSDTVHFDRKSILGFVTDTGGRTSHAAIMAKSLHIPYVVNSYNYSQIIQSNDKIILDGNEGKIIVNPSIKTIKTYVDLKKKHESTFRKLLRESALPTMTKDGTRVSVMANVEFVSELKETKKAGAEGIGLLRTEGIFIQEDKLLSEDEQTIIYRKFASGMSGMPVIIRTIDAGGDKIFPDMQEIDELNPFLGWRAIRFCLDEPDIFKTQLRAILRANKNGNVRILLPMITSIHEVEETKNLLIESIKELKDRGEKIQTDIKMGLMIETPAAAILAEEFAQVVDFFSIGSNDLTQYTLAVDRTNNKISPLFDDMHPAVLRLIHSTVKIAKKYDLDVSICGEMAGNPKAIALLLGIGLRVLSVSPGNIPLVKKIIRQLTINECEKLGKNILKMSKFEDISKTVDNFYQMKINNLGIIN